MGIKIIIYGAYGEANIGDDLLLDTILFWLAQKSPNSEIFIVSKESVYLNKLYPNFTFLSKTSAKYLRSDLFILGGGTQLFSFYNNNPRKKGFYLRKFLQIFIHYIPLIYEIIKFKIIPINQKGKKIALGIGLGPFEKGNYLTLLKKTLSGFSMLYLRDEISFELCKEIHLPSKHTADICFSSYFLDRYPFKHNSSHNKFKKVGVVIRDWEHNENGEILNSKMLNWIDCNLTNYDITVFLFSSIKDIGLTNKLALNKKVKCLIWNPLYDNFSNYLNIFSEMDAIITSRFHAGVFGANFNIPTICLGLDPKLYMLFLEIKGFYYFEIANDIDKINFYLEDIFSNYSTIRNDIQISRQFLSKKADEQFDHAVRFL